MLPNGYAMVGLRTLHRTIGHFKPRNRPGIESSQSNTVSESEKIPFVGHRLSAESAATFRVVSVPRYSRNGEEQWFVNENEPIRPEYDVKYFLWGHSLKSLHISGHSENGIPKVILKTMAQLEIYCYEIDILRVIPNKTSYEEALHRLNHAEGLPEDSIDISLVEGIDDLPYSHFLGQFFKDFLIHLKDPLMIVPSLNEIPKETLLTVMRGHYFTSDSAKWIVIKSLRLLHKLMLATSPNEDESLGVKAERFAPVMVMSFFQLNRRELP